MKTVFCDIDGTLLNHTGDIIKNNLEQSVKSPGVVLPAVTDVLKQWDRASYTLVLTTGRKESLRSHTENQLRESGIFYDQLIMGLPNGDRILINDRKANSPRNTAYAINLVRNSGLSNVDFTSKNITIPDKYLFTKIEKPWGYEELIECNDKYVVKKLFMKKEHSCSIQYHELKKETIVVLTGALKISIGESLETLKDAVYGQGDTVTIEPYTVHRMEAVEDCLYMETSTNELWDVIRLKDNYGRC